MASSLATKKNGKINIFLEDEKTYHSNTAVRSHLFFVASSVDLLAIVLFAIIVLDICWAIEQRDGFFWEQAAKQLHWNALARISGRTLGLKKKWWKQQIVIKNRDSLSLIFSTRIPVFWSRQMAIEMRQWRVCSAAIGPIRAASCWCWRRPKSGKKKQRQSKIEWGI